uniref:ATP synthase complex subunit 8 n=1 Tax=Elateroides dermestoides TaxID=295947 RepID=E3VTD0_9CUCU|nr:ATP synthase F0 subunit 8 [Elateroides dermestoides]
MPQMAPLSWLMLMFMFISILILFNTINYWSFIYSTKSYSLSKKNNLLNWKW